MTQASQEGAIHLMPSDAVNVGHPSTRLFVETKVRTPPLTRHEAASVSDGAHDRMDPSQKRCTASTEHCHASCTPDIYCRGKSCRTQGKRRGSHNDAGTHLCTPESPCPDASMVISAAAPALASPPPSASTAARYPTRVMPSGDARLTGLCV